MNFLNSIIRPSLKALLLLTRLLPLLFMLVINTRFYSAPHLAKPVSLQTDVLKQLQFIEEEIHKHDLANRMQQLFPEGYIFTHVIYGLTWCEMAMQTNNAPTVYAHAIREAEFAYHKIDTDYARSIFPSSLAPTYGAFYHGWKNYLLGKILLCKKEKTAGEISRFKKNCAEIATAFQTHDTPFLPSYIDAAWPADACVAMASLGLHDRFLQPLYDTLRKNWAEKVRQRLHPARQMIPHSVDPQTGMPLENARGCSMSLMLIFLPDIDQRLAQEQFRIYRTAFPKYTLGLPGIREYLPGEQGDGDVDSGPVILDVGFSATIVSVGTFKRFGDFNMAHAISGDIESFGFPVSTGFTKKYAFGLLPVADIFLAWARMQPADTPTAGTADTGSPLFFHLLSLPLLVLLYFQSMVKLLRFFIKTRKNST